MRIEDHDDEHEAAQRVVGAHYAGHQQRPAILGWAGYKSVFGGEWPDRGVRALLDSGDAEHLYMACRDVPDMLYTPKLTDALTETRDPRWLAVAACNLPDDRYDSRILDALIALRDQEWIDYVACYLPAKRATPSLLRLVQMRERSGNLGL